MLIGACNPMQSDASESGHAGQFIWKGCGAFSMTAASGESDPYSADGVAARIAAEAVQ